MAAAPRTRAADPVTVTFDYTGAEQAWEVPAAVTSIHVVAIGGHGGAGNVSPGGGGARVEGDLAVTPGMQLFVEVGGNGADFASGPTLGGFNGGGGGGGSATGFWAASGGGASDIRTVSRTAAGSLESRLIVAGGGGGAGLSGSTSDPGGDAGQQGGGGQSGGGPGTTSGGLGGTGDVAGGDGGLGVGGDGAIGDFVGGGAGGGGFYGGGGGGVLGDVGGGGGGGSSHLGAATGGSVSVDDSGVPLISITYMSIPNSGTVAAQVTVPTSAACLQLSTTSVEFGTLALGSEDQAGNPTIGVTNCSGVDETVFARATDATGGGVSWGLVDSPDTCTTAVPLATDTYRLSLAAPLESLGLSTTNKELASLASGASETRTARIYTACPGSSGAGSTMSMQIVFLATE
jgi:hypothetical protein